MDSLSLRSSRGASLASADKLATGLVQKAPRASLNQVFWMLSSLWRLDAEAVPYTMHP